jgi:uncharacterized protein
VLSPDWPGSRWILLAVFVAILVLLILRARRRSRNQYRQFKRLRDTVRRQAMFRVWLRDAFLAFGAISAVLLALSWQYIPLVLDEIRAAGWYLEVASHVNLPAIAIGFAAAFVVVPLGLLVLAGRQESVPTVGDIQALIPRNTAEVKLGALLAINAGVLEEIVFRVAMPAVLFGATGSAATAIVVSVAVFGGLHAYQGVSGVIGTTVIGVLLLVLYIASGSILVPIIVHVLIDLRSFVFIPLIVLRVHMPPLADEDVTPA